MHQSAKHMKQTTTGQSLSLNLMPQIAAFAVSAGLVGVLAAASPSKAVALEGDEVSVLQCDLELQENCAVPNSQVNDAVGEQGEDSGTDAGTTHVQNADGATSGGDTADVNGDGDAAGKGDSDNQSDFGGDDESKVASDADEVGGEQQSTNAQGNTTVGDSSAGESAEDGTTVSDSNSDANAEIVLSAQGENGTNGDNSDPITYLNMYRLYNPNSGEHFYTANLAEAQHVASVGWRWEGIGWVAPSRGAEVYRLYNPNAGDHHYTLDVDERDHLVSVGWKYEGIGWYSAESGIDVLRQYNPNAWTGTHNFTTNAGEDAHLGSVGWKREGKAWTAADVANQTIPGFWLVTSAWGTLERYWIDSTANVAKNRMISAASDGSGYDAYATATGAIVRNDVVYLNSTYYLADNDGKLTETHVVNGKVGYQNPSWMLQVSSNTVWGSWRNSAWPFNYVTPSRIAVDANRSECVEAFVRRAYDYLGSSYIWDYACAPSVGVDCAGLVLQCAYACGMNFGEMNPYNHYYKGLSGGWHSAYANALWNHSQLERVSLSNRRRGDVISWPGHVAVYLGNDQIIEAASASEGVRKSSLWRYGTPRGVIRLFH